MLLRFRSMATCNKHPVADRTEGETMDIIIKLYVGLSQGKFGRRYARLTTAKGQTMTEYALLLSGVAVVVYSSYKTLGTSITPLLTRIDGNL